MIDPPDRTPPRFPSFLESAARPAIRTRLESVLQNVSPDAKGYASCARGGDILFHEEARSLRLPTVIVLPFRPKTFLKTSVEGVSEGEWPKRFFALWENTTEEDHIVLDLPRSSESYAVCNSRIIELAQSRGPFHAIVLWDGKVTKKPGGAADFIQKARDAGDEPDIIDPASLAT